jgi:pentatricopeptide repeat protein
VFKNAAVVLLARRAFASKPSGGNKASSASRASATSSALARTGSKSKSAAGAKRVASGDNNSDNDNDNDNSRPNRIVAETAEDFEFRGAYASKSDYTRARLMYDLLTMPIRSPLRKAADEGDDVSKPVDESAFWRTHAFNGVGVSRLLRQFMARRDFDGALRVYERAEAAAIADLRHLTSLLTVCPTLAAAEQHVMPRASAFGSLDTHFFSALLRVHARERSVGFEVLAMMEKAGVVPDTVIYTDLVRNCAALERYDDCWRLYNEMRLRNIDADEVLYTEMIFICGKRAETERAIGLYEEMVRFDLRPTDVTYDALIRVCAGRFDYAKEAVLMFERMRASGYAPSSKTYSHVMMALGHYNDRHALDAMYEQAVAETGRSAQLDARLLFSYARQFDVGARTSAAQYYERAAELWKHYVSADDTKKTPPDIMVDAYLRFLCQAHFLDRSSLLFERYPATSQRVTTMLQMYYRVRRADHAVALAQKSLLKGLLNADGLAAALGACARAYYAKSGTSLWLEAAHAGVLPDASAPGVRAFLAFLETIKRDGDIEKLRALTQRGPRTVERQFFEHEKGTEKRVRFMNRPMPPPVTE